MTNAALVQILAHEIELCSVRFVLQICVREIGFGMLDGVSPVVASLGWSTGRPSAMQWCRGRWSEAEWAEDKRWTDGGLKEVVGIKDLHEGTEGLGEVPKVATGADQRALGVQVNMEGCWSGAVQKAGAEVEVTARASTSHQTDAFGEVTGGEV